MGAGRGPFSEVRGGSAKSHAGGRAISSNASLLTTPP